MQSQQQAWVDSSLWTSCKTGVRGRGDLWTGLLYVSADPNPKERRGKRSGKERRCRDVSQMRFVFLVTYLNCRFLLQRRLIMYKPALEDDTLNSFQKCCFYSRLAHEDAVWNGFNDPVMSSVELRHYLLTQLPEEYCQSPPQEVKEILIEFGQVFHVNMLSMSIMSKFFSRKFFQTQRTGLMSQHSLTWMKEARGNLPWTESCWKPLCSPWLGTCKLRARHRGFMTNSGENSCAEFWDVLTHRNHPSWKNISRETTTDRWWMWVSVIAPKTLWLFPDCWVLTDRLFLQVGYDKSNCLLLSILAQLKNLDPNWTADMFRRALLEHMAKNWDDLLILHVCN